MSQYPYARKVELGYSTDEKVVFNFFNTVYAWMAVGLAVTAVTAWYTSHSPAIMSLIYGSRFMLIACSLGAFAIAMSVQSAALRISAAAGLALFMLYAVVIGMICSSVFVIYPMPILGAAFLITAGVFGGMSVFGFVTKRDLTSMGSILVMVFWGVFLASIANLFIASTALDWVITYAILVIFLGLTAYRTQMLKAIAWETRGAPQLAARYAVVGSLLLYISFVNLFLAILRILGSRR
jgi:hypothetical protein